MRRPSGKSRFSWYDDRNRDLLLQVSVVAAVVGLAVWLGLNLDRNLTRLGLAVSFRFLRERASFDIGEAVIPYSPSDTYWRAIAVGFVNSLRVSAAGIVLATLLGTIIGTARLSSNWLARTLARSYVEILRNTPLLLQLLFWYFVAFVRGDVVTLPGQIFLTPDGLVLPSVQPVAIAIAFVGLGLVALGLTWSARKLPERNPLWAILGIGLLTALGAVVWRDRLFDIPQLDVVAGRASGGLQLTPEFSALVLGLTLYTAAFIAEIVRAGLESVPRGQWEAARALGLHRGLVLRLVVFPQSMRAILPPLTGEYLNLWKNSSLAAVVGYPDLYFVTSTTFNQTGRAVEAMLLLGLAYLSVSLAIAAVANRVNRAIAQPN